MPVVIPLRFLIVLMPRIYDKSTTLNPDKRGSYLT